MDQLNHDYVEEGGSLTQPATEAPNWRAIGLIITIAPLFLGFVYFAYDRWINVPIVTYEIKPLQGSDGNLSALLIISNSGLIRATGLRTLVRTLGPIVSVEIDSIDIAYADPWQNLTRLIISMPRLVQGDSVYIWLRVLAYSAEVNPILTVDIVFDQGIGNEKGLLTPPSSFFSIAGFLLSIAVVTMSILSLIARYRGHART